MNKKVITIPGIKAIYMVPRSKLQSAMEYKDEVGIPIAIYTDLKEVCFCGNATCEAVRYNEKNGFVEKTTLKFMSSHVLPEFGKYAFIIKDAGGKAFCIGAKESPGVIVKRTRNIGTPDAEPTVMNYTITRNSIRSLIPVSI